MINRGKNIAKAHTDILKTEILSWSPVMGKYKEIKYKESTKKEVHGNIKEI